MTAPDDRLAELRAQLDVLDETPLSSHPEVLEQAHRALVEELDRLEDLGEMPEGASSLDGDEKGSAT